MPAFPACMWRWHRQCTAAVAFYVLLRYPPSAWLFILSIKRLQIFARPRVALLRVPEKDMGASVLPLARGKGCWRDGRRRLDGGGDSRGGKRSIAAVPRRCCRICGELALTGPLCSVHALLLPYGIKHYTRVVCTSHGTVLPVLLLRSGRRCVRLRHYCTRGLCRLSTSRPRAPALPGLLRGDARAPFASLLHRLFHILVTLLHRRMNAT